MDGKSGAEELIAKALKDETLLNALTSAPKPEGESADAAKEE
jgi:type VI secretion system protein ImpB